VRFRLSDPDDHSKEEELKDAFRAHEEVARHLPMLVSGERSISYKFQTIVDAIKDARMYGRGSSLQSLLHNTHIFYVCTSAGKFTYLANMPLPAFHVLTPAVSGRTLLESLVIRRDQGEEDRMMMMTMLNRSIFVVPLREDFLRKGHCVVRALPRNIIV